MQDEDSGRINYESFNKWKIVEIEALSSTHGKVYVYNVVST